MSFFLILKRTITTFFASLWGGKKNKTKIKTKNPRPQPLVGMMCPHGLVERQFCPQPPTWPQEWNTKEGSLLPKCHCLLISLVPCDLFTRNNNLLPSPGTTLLAARRVRPRPASAGDSGVPEPRSGTSRQDAGRARGCLRGATSFPAARPGTAYLGSPV